MKVESFYWGNRLIAENDKDIIKLKEIVKVMEGINIGGYEYTPEPLKIERHIDNYTLDIGR